MSKKQLFLVATYLCLLIFKLPLLAQLVPEKLPVLLINEVHNEDYLNDDVFIELVVLKVNAVAYDRNDPSPKVIIDDSNVQGVEPGFISIDPECLNDIKPGDLIVLHGSNTDVSGAGEALLFEIHDDCISLYEDIPNSQNPSYEGATPDDGENKTFKDFISFTGPGDMIQSKSDNIFNQKLDQTGSENISLEGQLGTYSNGKPHSLGNGNSEANISFINSLKNNANNIAVGCDVISVVNINDVLITLPVFNPTVLNTTSYTVAHPGHTTGSILVASPNPNGIVNIQNLRCGSHTLTVKDSNGNTLDCQIEINYPEQFELDWCSSIPLILNENLTCEETCQVATISGNQDDQFYYGQQIPLDPNGENVITVKHSDQFGSFLNIQTITINVIVPGEPCDDGDSCTKDDMINDECHCKGIPVELDMGIYQVCDMGNTLYAEITPENAVITAYEWSTGHTSSPITIDQAGTYELTITDSNDCQVSDAITVKTSGNVDDADNDGTCDPKELENCINDSNFPCKKESYFLEKNFTCQAFPDIAKITPNYGTFDCSNPSTGEVNIRTATSQFPKICMYDYSANAAGEPFIDILSSNSDPSCTITNWRDNIWNNAIKYIESLDVQPSSVAIVISINRSMCEVTPGEEAYKNAEVGLWYHLWCGDQEECICYKGKGINNALAYNFLFDNVPSIKVSGVKINDSQLLGTEVTPSQEKFEKDTQELGETSQIVKYVEATTPDLKAIIDQLPVYTTAGSETATFKFIISAEGQETNEDRSIGDIVTNDSAALAADDFNNSTSHDFTIWVNRNKNGELILCVRVLEALDYKDNLISMAEYVAQRDNLSEVQATVTLAEDEDGIGGDPLFMGKRPTYEGEVNFWSVISHACGIGRQVSSSGTFPKPLWENPDMPDPRVMWDFSGLVCGPLTGIIEENPVAGAVQAINLVKAVCSGKIPKEKILKAMRSPFKTAAAFLHEEYKKLKETLKGDNGPEKQQFELGKLSVQTIMRFLNGYKSLIDLLENLDNSVPSTSAINKLTDDRPTDWGDKFNTEIGKHLSDQDAMKLSKDIDDVPELKDHLTKQFPEDIEAYKFAVNHKKIRKHPASLRQLTKMLNDPDFIAKLPNGKADLEDILGAVKNPLNPGTNFKLIDLPTHLENIESLVKNHGGSQSTPGFGKVLDDLKKDNFIAQDGITHSVNDLKNYNANDIKSFDLEFEGDNVLCTRCRNDLVLRDGPPKLIEHKSWTLEYIKNISGKQLAEYFGNDAVEKITDMKYTFNKLKTPDIDLVKPEVLKAIDSNKITIWNRLKSNGPLKADLGIIDYDDFVDS